MDIQEIQRRLAKPALQLIPGGFRPSGSDEESWLGRVFLFREDEELPRNSAGETLLPFAQFYLPALPFHSPLLEGVRAHGVRRQPLSRAPGTHGRALADP